PADPDPARAVPGLAEPVQGPGRRLPGGGVRVKRLLIILVLLGLAAGGAYWWYEHHGDGQQTASATGGRRGFGGARRGGPDPETPIPVLAANSQLRDVPIYLDAL